MSREVFVLGAGFSRAISAHMPLADGLGEELARKHPEVFGSIGEQSFEEWLSHRAEPQPYLDPAENLHRQAVFASASSLIAELLDKTVSQALRQEMPSWLGELISLWHLDESNVLTFNYDPLVECAFQSLRLWDWRRSDYFTWSSLINYNPPGLSGASIGEFDGTLAPIKSFRLWKLHGSTNWFWSPGDQSGASATRVDLPGEFGAPRSIASADHHWMAPGRQRLLVPPSALKSPYYSNPVTREVWARAFEALCEADVITLVGYSLPASDLTTSGMLHAALERGSAREVRVVDFAPDAVVNRVRRAIPSRIQVTPHGAGQSAVPKLVERMLSDATRRGSRELRDHLGSCTQETRLVVTWGDSPHGGRTPGPHGRTAAVLSVKTSTHERTLHLECGDITTLEGATAVGDGSVPAALPASHVEHLLGDVDRVLVSVPGMDQPATIIAATSRRVAIGQGDGSWIQLIPAGALRTP